MERESFKSRLGFLLVSAGCAVGIGNVWKFPYVVGQNGGGWFVLDSEDFLVSNLLLPLGSLVYHLFCVTGWGWNFENYQKEANTGRDLKIAGWMKYYFRFALPVLILIILIQGLV